MGFNAHGRTGSSFVGTGLYQYCSYQSDDVGFGDFSCNGAYGYKTPNIDNLASQGVRFTHFLACQPISGASRAGLLTGCYPNRIGFSGAPGPDSDYGIHPEEMTMGELLKQKGYSTAIFGKWHLGDARSFFAAKWF